jgi:hypothetical protein
LRYPADPPTVEEIVRVMRAAGEGPVADRLRGMIVVLWRSGLRVNEALALSESDLDRGRGAILVRRGKGGKRREVGMDAWGWQQLEPWLQIREQLRVGALFCIINGPNQGRPWTQDAVRFQLRRTAVEAAVRRRFAPHQLRHAHAGEMAREGVPIVVIQRQLGHANLGITRSTSKESTTRGSSTPSTTAQHPSSLPPLASNGSANPWWEQQLDSLVERTSSDEDSFVVEHGDELELSAECVDVARDRRESGVGATFELRDVRLRHGETLRDRRLARLAVLAQRRKPQLGLQDLALRSDQRLITGLDCSLANSAPRGGLDLRVGHQRFSRCAS